jgi:hypothetical protein
VTGGGGRDASGSDTAYERRMVLSGVGRQGGDNRKEGMLRAAPKGEARAAQRKDTVTSAHSHDAHTPQAQTWCNSTKW